MCNRYLQGGAFGALLLEDGGIDDSTGENHFRIGVELTSEKARRQRKQNEQADAVGIEALGGEGCSRCHAWP